MRDGKTSSPTDRNETGIIYVRVSTDKQVREGRSIEDQENSLRRKAEVRNIDINKVIIDESKSGTHFDREGLRELYYLVLNTDIDYILVDGIDRIGRQAVMTLYFIHHLRSTHNVAIITNECGELNILDNNDLMYIAMDAVQSQSVVETSARRSNAAIVQNFKNKKWMSVFNKIPFGYQSNDDDAWISKDPTETEIVKQINKTYLDAEPSRAYTVTYNKVDGIPSDMERWEVRRMLGRRLYIGKPTTEYVDYTRNDRSKSKTTVVDQSLRIISDEEHQAVRKKKEYMKDKFGPDNREPHVGTLVRDFGVDSVDELIDIARCPDCGTPVVKALLDKE